MALNIEEVYNKAIAGLNVKDQNNPVSLLSENFSTGLVTALKSFDDSNRLVYPYLAENENELLSHVNYKDEDGLFSTPSKTAIKVKMNVVDLLNNSVVNGTRNSIIIDKYTTIEVGNINFTVLNDVKVVINTNEVGGTKHYSSFVENIVSKESIDYKNTGVLYSNIEYDDKNIMWVSFDLPVIQAKMSIVLKRIVEEGVNVFDFELKHKYYKTIIERKQGGVWHNVDKVFSYSRTDLSKPAVYVKVGDKKVMYELNKVASEGLNGEMRFIVLETLGRTYINMKEFEAKEYVINISSATVKKIGIRLSCDVVINSGKDKLEFRSLKKNIVNRVYDNRELPITEAGVIERLRREGLNGFILGSSILSRVFGAKRDIFKSKNLLPYSHYGFYLFDPRETTEVKLIDDSLIIREYTYFKNDNGLKPVPKLEIDELKKNIRNLKEELYITPFRYIVSNVDEVNVEVYNVTKPKMDALTIIDKNKQLSVNCNINGYLVFNEGNGYRVFYRVVGNDVYNSIKNDIVLDIEIPIDKGVVKFDGVIDENINTNYFGSPNGLYSTFIDVGLKVSNGKMKIMNGVSVQPDRFADLKGDMSVVLRYKDNTLSSDAIAVAFYIGDGIGITKQSLSYSFIRKVENIINDGSLYYNKTRYKTYGVDVPMLYKEDVYELDKKSGCKFVMMDTTGDGKVDKAVRVLKHAKGTPVMIDGKAVMEHKSGDIITVGGVPVVDKEFGKSGMVGMLLLDGLFTLLDSKSGNVNEVMDDIDTITVDILGKVNDELLEKTRCLYVPWLTFDDVVDNNDVKYGNTVRPLVHLYFRKGDTYDVEKIKSAYGDVGGLIRKELSKLVIDVNDMERKVLEMVGNGVLGVTIDGIPKRNMVLKTGSNRFKIPYKVDNGYVVSLAIDFKVESI